MSSPACALVRRDLELQLAAAGWATRRAEVDRSRPRQDSDAPSERPLRPASRREQSCKARQRESVSVSVRGRGRGQARMSGALLELDCCGRGFYFFRSARRAAERDEVVGGLTGSPSTPPPPRPPRPAPPRTSRCPACLPPKPHRPPSPSKSSSSCSVRRRPAPCLGQRAPPPRLSLRRESPSLADALARPLAPGDPTRPGEAAVGKSSLVMRFVSNDFAENKEPTIGAGASSRPARRSGSLASGPALARPQACVMTVELTLERRTALLALAAFLTQKCRLEDKVIKVRAVALLGRGRPALEAMAGGAAQLTHPSPPHLLAV